MKAVATGPLTRPATGRVTGARARWRRGAGVFTALFVTGSVVGCSAPPASPGAPSAASSAAASSAATSSTAAPAAEVAPWQQAQEVLQVTTVHEQTGMTLLEGPVFAPDGRLLVVDVTAPADQPKVLGIDLDTETVSPVVAGGAAAGAVYTSAQISPADGRLYLTDLVGGKVDSVTLEGQDLRTVFAGPVQGEAVLPDDVTFDEAGNIYVSDTTGHDQPFGQPRGRVIRIDPVDGSVLVLADDLPAPNGISFDEGFTGLYVSQYSANRIDYLALTDQGRQVSAAHPAVHVDTGAAQVGSNAVDADGNIYQGLHGRARVQVFAPTGRLLTTIEAPVPEGGACSATNVALRPGTREGVITVSGPGGGFLYTFDAVGEGIRQSNGG